ncbi:MAG: energy-coupling factor transporter transmembrane protein EcfT [Ruminococcaceae bacterium]|nr:energy-coupling factor transporter transmembrane protein EcfT [Oscillospiraceae bacterium]
MGFERCHPAVNLLYFTAVITGMLVFQHPVFLIASYICAFIYSIKRNHRKAFLFNLLLLPLVATFALYYSSYTHFGVTILQKNLIGNNITLESLVYGVVLGLSVAGTCMWFSCVYSVFSADKVVYLFGKASPRLSLFLAILLRMIPRIKKEVKRINTAQSGIGLGIGQGTVWQRLRNGIRILSMVITWTIESLATASDSMRSRGSLLRGRKAFSIYRFDNRDRAYVVVMFACLTITLMGVMLRQMDMQYDPRIVFPTFTPMFWIFVSGYLLLCLMPVILEIWTEYRFRKARQAI